MATSQAVPESILSTEAPPAARYCADTFNSAIASAAISAAWEIGLLDELATAGRVDICLFAKGRDSDPDAVRAILVALSSRRIVVLDASRSEATTDIGFDSAYSTKGFFYWLTRGCGELFTTLPTKVANDIRHGEYVRRDARAISVACRNIARTFFDPPSGSSSRTSASPPWRTWGAAAETAS
jgi:phenylpyruvate C(3)-methyltransferase